MQSEAAAAILVLFRALVLAQSSAASEIGVDHLLAALDADVASNEPVATLIAERYVAVPKQDMPLAPDVVAALGRFREISTIPLDVLRSALVSAKPSGGG
jgi:hypothetical protein